MKKKYFLQFIILKTILNFFQLFSFKYASLLGGLLIRKIGPSTKFASVAASNLNIAFPELDAKHQQQIISGMWDNLGRSIGEFCHLLKSGPDFINKHITVHNEHNLKYLENGGLIFSAHLANWEISQSILRGNKRKIYIVYRALNNPYIDELVKKYRAATGAEMIPKGKEGAKKIIEAIKEKSIIIMLVDQRQREGIIIPFFNQPCHTSTAIASLAIKYNLPILPIHTERRGAKFDIWIDEPLNLRLTSDKTLDIQSIMLQINKIIEAWVKKNPAQWFWIHRRWSFEKTHKN
jgi:KDO2-lipid IV(A) lauroyltransferase